MISVKDLCKSFHVHEKEPGLRGSLSSLFRRRRIEKQALRNVSLEVSSGEIVGLVGANGAGKTTLVKVLAGIIHPSSGAVSVLGFDPWQRRNEFRRQISLVMGQKAQLWWDLPAGDSFLLLREIYQIPLDLYSQRLEELLDALQVRRELKTPIRKLSLGERMKFELIAALLHQPRVLFLDEPTIGLDLTSQRSIRRFLLNYREKHRPAMIITSHYMDDIDELCERIVIIRSGEIVYDGALARLLSQHASDKIVRLTLSEQTAEARIREAVGSHLTAIAGDEITARADRTQIAELAARLLRELPVQDLNIEEQDIGSIIESIMRV